jgi:hypothetical protein
MRSGLRMFVRGVFFLKRGFAQGTVLALTNELLDRDFWISVRRVEGKLLPGRSARGKDAVVLLGTVFNHRDKLYVSPDSGAENNRQLEGANAGAIPVCAESSTENHALVEAARLRRHAGIFLQSHNRSGRTTRPSAVSITADVQERCRRVELISTGISFNARRLRISSRVLVR